MGDQPDLGDLGPAKNQIITPNRGSIRISTIQMSFLTLRGSAFSPTLC